MKGIITYDFRDPATDATVTGWLDTDHIVSMTAVQVPDHPFTLLITYLDGTTAPVGNGAHSKAVWLAWQKHRSYRTLREDELLEELAALKDYLRERVEEEEARTTRSWWKVWTT